MKVGSCLGPGEMPDSNFLLPLFWLGSSFDFQVANLLVATHNFEPWDNIVVKEHLHVHILTHFMRKACQNGLLFIIEIFLSYDGLKHPFCLISFLELHLFMSDIS